MSDNKVYTRRDSATAFLKKQGIAKDRYNECIKTFKDADGYLFEVDMKVVGEILDEKYVIPPGRDEQKEDRRTETKEVPVERRAGMADLKETTQALKETVKTLASLQGKKTAKKVVRQPGRTVSSVARDLIIAGRSNDEVWKALKQEFKLDSSKKHYPAWYRSEVKRKGLIK